MSPAEELSALRREVVTLRMRVGRMDRLMPRKCFGPVRCAYLDTRGVFPQCKRIGAAVGPNDFCSRYRPIPKSKNEA